MTARGQHVLRKAVVRSTRRATSEYRVRLKYHGRDFALSIAAGLLAGCSSSTPSHPTPQVPEQVLSSRSPAWSIAAAPTMTPADGTPSGALIEEGVTDGVGELDTLLGAVLVTVSDRLRVRSKPSVSDDSIKYEPPLPLGTLMYAFNGPVRASGYDWYEVALVSVGLTTPGLCGEQRCDPIYSGWVASQSRDGELWLADGEADCPPVPNDVAAVVTIPLGARLACFSRKPITIRARLIECYCDVDGGGFDPAWFGVDDQPLLLVEPSATYPPADSRDWLIVALDPSGRYPELLPVGHAVEVTGMFDHPDAQNCLFGDIPVDTAGPPAPTAACRFMFATTSLVADQS